MSETVHTQEELKELQALPLELKVMLTKSRIREWVHRYGEDGVYVGYSGGKDSTVLLHIVREEFPSVPGVFVDTGLEFPELRKHVLSTENVVILKPKMNFREVIRKYGYPFISKEVSRKIHECRVTESKGKESYARKQFEGTYISKNGKTNMVSVRRRGFMVDSKYKFSHMCCSIMKKDPSKHYEKETGRYAMLGQMAEESYARRQMWIRYGCNGFNKTRPTSNPMSFWTEQDVLWYIKLHNLPIPSVYGDIVEEDQLEGQMSIEMYDGVCDSSNINRPVLKTTGCDRTGCIFCGFGCHMKGDNKFERLKETHPHIYE